MLQSVKDLLCNCECMSGHKNSFEGLFTHFPFATIKIQVNLGEVKKAIQTTNPKYDIDIKRLHLYNDMKLVTFGIDENRNLIVQFPVFTAIHSTTTDTISNRNSA